MLECGYERILVGGSILVILLVPIFGVVRLYRDTYMGTATSFSDRLEGFQQSLIAFFTASSGTASDTSAVFLDRLSPDPVDYVFIKTPEEFPFAGFSGMNRLPYMFLPQVVLPNRPDLIDGNEVAIEYGAGQIGTNGNSLSVVGDGYRRFGWPGIVMLYALIAICSAVVAARAWANRDRLEWISSLVILLVCLNGENTMSTLISTFYYVIWIFPKYFLFFLLLRVLSEVVTRTHAPQTQRRSLPLTPTPAI